MGTTVTNTDDYAMISALQHLLFCPRQAALIHVEQVWTDNHLTLAGDELHRNVDEAGLAMRQGTRFMRALPLVCHRLRLTGRADLVAQEPDGTLVPIEYKHGRRNRWLHNEVQLCAQAMALEEMMDTTIEQGLIYYHRSRRRQAVPIDAKLRAATQRAAADLHAMLQAGTTPPAINDRRCEQCSLIEWCLPQACDGTRSARRYLEDQL